VEQVFVRFVYKKHNSKLGVLELNFVPKNPRVSDKYFSGKTRQTTHDLC
jgi:hypothetical protein